MSNIKMSELHSTDLFQDLSNDDAETVKGGSLLSQLLGIDIKLVQNNGELVVQRIVLFGNKIYPID